MPSQFDHFNVFHSRNHIVLMRDHTTGLSGCCWRCLFRILVLSIVGRRFRYFRNSWSLKSHKFKVDFNEPARMKQPSCVVPFVFDCFSCAMQLPELHSHWPIVRYSMWDWSDGIDWVLWLMTYSVHVFWVLWRQYSVRSLCHLCVGIELFVCRGSLRLPNRQAVYWNPHSVHRTLSGRWHREYWLFRPVASRRCHTYAPAVDILPLVTTAKWTLNLHFIFW